MIEEFNCGKRKEHFLNVEVSVEVDLQDLVSRTKSKSLMP
jgi:hypothetical protein